MPTKLIRDTIRFARGKGGPMEIIRSYNFPAKVSSASAVLTGFATEFLGGDHNLGRVKVDLEVSAPGSTTITVTAHLELRDFSGNWDDDYAGDIEFLVFVEVAAPPPLIKGVAANLA